MPWAAGLTSELQEGWTIAQQEPTRCRTKAFAGWLLEHENRASNINLFETVARLAKALTHRPQYRQQSCPLACQAICMNISVELLQSFPRTILHLTCASLLTPLTLTTTLLLFPADGIASSTTNDLEVDSTVEANSGFEDSPKAVIDEAWQIVHQEYVDGSFNQTDWQLTRQELLGQEYTSREAAYSALRGALQQLNDPYTRFLSPSEYSDLTDQTSGEVSGIGIYVQKDSTTGDVLITEVASGSPAEQADLRVGDKIMLVDGQSTARLTLQGVSQKLRGEEGYDLSQRWKSKICGDYTGSYRSGDRRTYPQRLQQPPYRVYSAAGIQCPRCRANGSSNSGSTRSGSRRIRLRPAGQSRRVTARQH